jgi:DNA-binding LytR/AlgR family response regulator
LRKRIEILPCFTGRYKVDALDYLLKPFGYDEFLRAASKARAYTTMLDHTVPAPIPVQEKEEEYLFLKVEYQLVRVAYKDILYIEGLKDYVKVHTKAAAKPILTLTSLKALEEKLPSKRFMRIHAHLLYLWSRLSLLPATPYRLKILLFL